MLLFGGFDRNDNAIPNSEIIDIDTFKVTNIYRENEDRPTSRGLHNILAMGPILLLYGGKSGNRENLNDIWKFIISTKKWIKLTETNEFFLYRSGFIFTKLIGTDRPVIFGGENRNKEIINDLILLDFPICQSETSIYDTTSCFPCAEGFILSSQQKCEECSVGTYSDFSEKYIESRCNYCPKGTYNDKKGVYGLDKCKICKYKTFNDEIGRSECNTCKINELCPPSKIKFKKKKLAI